jgi:hypothetical protein
MSVIAYGSGGPQPRDGLYDVMAGAESWIPSLDLECSLEPGSPAELG